MSLFNENIQTYIFKTNEVSSNEFLVYDQDENRIGTVKSEEKTTKNLFQNDETLVFKIKKKKKPLFSLTKIWEIEDVDGKNNWNCKKKSFRNWRGT